MMHQHYSILYVYEQQYCKKKKKIKKKRADPLCQPVCHPFKEVVCEYLGKQLPPRTVLKASV